CLLWVFRLLLAVLTSHLLRSLPYWGQRHLPSGMGMNGPLPPITRRALVQMFARAMNPCEVGFSRMHLHNRMFVALLGVSRPSVKHAQYRASCSKYLGASSPSSSRGHRARSSFAGWPETRSPPASAVGCVTAVPPSRRIFIGRRCQVADRTRM